MIDIEEAVGELIIVKRCVDLLFSIVFLCICTIVVVAFFNIQAYFVFDKSKNWFTIPI